MMNLSPLRRLGLAFVLIPLLGLIVGAKLLSAKCIESLDELPPPNAGTAAQKTPPASRKELKQLERDLIEKQIEQLTERIEKEGKKVETIAERGQLRQELGQTSEAAADFEVAVSLAPQNIDYLRQLAQLHGELGKIKEAEEDFTLLLKRDQSAQTYLARGNFYYDRWNTKKALDNFTNAIEQDPTLAEAYAKRGHILFSTTTGREQYTGQTLSDLEKGVQLDGEQILARRDLIQIYIYDAVRRYDEAVRHATVILERIPDDACARYLRSRANYLRGKYQLAIDDLDIVIKNDPASSRNLVRRAEAYRELDETDKAIQDFQQAVKVDSQNFAAYTYLARMLLSSKRYEEAILAYEKAMALNPQKTSGLQGDMYSELANALVHVGRLQESQQNYAKAAVLVPGINYNKLQQANVLALMHRFDEALEIYDAIIRSRSYSTEVFERRALVQLAMGNVDEAFEDISTFIKKNPASPHGYDLRAKIWRRKGNDEEAQADAKRAQEAQQKIDQRRSRK